MKRRAFQMVVLLFLGAIANVAVAWALDVSAKPNKKSTEPIAGEVSKWVEANLPAPFEGEIHKFDRITSFGCELIQAPESWRISTAPDYFQRKRSGFPWLAMEQAYWFIYAHKIDSPYQSWPISKRKGLPTRFLWPGFAINTIFYAAILWVLFFGPGMVRRRIRRRRGLCPACAYPIGSSPVCTECGAPVRMEVNFRKKGQQ